MKTILGLIIAGSLMAQGPIAGPSLGGSGGGGGGVSSVSGTSPIASSGGATPAISCPTCVTSAASLTSFGNMVGGGGQASQTSSQFVVSNLGAPGTETWTLTNTGLGVTPAGGHALTNTTAAAAGAQQISPPIVFTGQGWKTNATAASQSVACRNYVLPVQQALAPTALWMLDCSIAGGAYSTVISVNSPQSGGVTPFTSLNFGSTANNSITASSQGLMFSFGGTAGMFLDTNGGVSTRAVATIGFFSGNTSPTGNTQDTTLSRFAAATLQHGAADAAAPVAQTIRMQSVVAGTSNTAGVNATIQGSIGTGTGVGGDILLKVAPAGTTGTAQNAAVTALTLSGTYGMPVVASVLFANLPAATNGGFIYCSDCTIAATCAGSGTGAFAKRLNSVWVCN